MMGEARLWDVWLAVAVALASNPATCAARVHPCAYSGISAGVAVAYRDRIVFLRGSTSNPKCEEPTSTCFALGVTRSTHAFQFTT
jgi:hypothetical protein